LGILMPPSFWKYLVSLRGGEKFILMWAWIASQMDEERIEFSFKNLAHRFDIPRSSFARHLAEVRQLWDKSETNLGQFWVRGGIGFQRVTPNVGTTLRQTWDKVETNLGQVEKQKAPETNKAKATSEDADTPFIEEVIAYLNEKTGKRYRASNQQASKLIKGRIKEGYDLDDFKKVIDNKYEAWVGSQQEMYLRPVTLFGNKFDSYLNESPDNRKAHTFHSKISNHATKERKWESAISDAEEISYSEFVDPTQRN